MCKCFCFVFSSDDLPYVCRVSAMFHECTAFHMEHVLVFVRSHRYFVHEDTAVCDRWRYRPDEVLYTSEALISCLQPTSRDLLMILFHLPWVTNYLTAESSLKMSGSPPPLLLDVGFYAICILLIQFVFIEFM